MISPFARHNYVDHNLSDMASIINLVEYNWRLPTLSGSADQILARTDRGEHIPFDLAGLFSLRGRRNTRLVLDPTTGQPVDRWSHQGR